jgi:hypothetical protein
MVGAAARAGDASSELPRCCELQLWNCNSIGYIIEGVVSNSTRTRVVQLHVQLALCSCHLALPEVARWELGEQLSFHNTDAMQRPYTVYNHGFHISYLGFEVLALYAEAQLVTRQAHTCAIPFACPAGAAAAAALINFYNLNYRI